MQLTDINKSRKTRVNKQVNKQEILIVIDQTGQLKSIVWSHPLLFMVASAVSGYKKSLVHRLNVRTGS